MFALILSLCLHQIKNVELNEGHDHVEQGSGVRFRILGECVYMERAGVVSVSDMTEGRLGTACDLLNLPLLRPPIHIFIILRRSCLNRTPMKTYRNGFTQACVYARLLAICPATSKAITVLQSFIVVLAACMASTMSRLL